MFKFAVKNMAIKKVKIILIVISIVISASVALLAYNISEQVDDGFKSTAGYYDVNMKYLVVLFLLLYCRHV